MISRSSHCSSVFAHTNASSLPLWASSSSSSPRFPPRPSPSSSRSSTARSASLSPLSLPSFVSIVPKVPFSSRVSFALPFASLLLASRSSPYYYYYYHHRYSSFSFCFSVALSCSIYIAWFVNNDECIPTVAFRFDIFPQNSFSPHNKDIRRALFSDEETSAPRLKWAATMILEETDDEERVCLAVKKGAS